MTLEGGCMCGRVRYLAEGEPFNPTICHCIDCRRAAGAPMVAWFSIAPAGLRFTAAEPHRFRSSPNATRSFCPHCGTPLTFQDQPDAIDVSTCTLDDPEALPPADHTRTARQLSWVRLADPLPRYPRPAGRRPARPRPAHRRLVTGRPDPTSALIEEDRAFQTVEPPFRRARRASILALIGFVGLCLLVWLANGAVTATSVSGWYRGLARPPGTPPDWLFGPVWTVLYVTIGVAGWLVWRRVDVAMHRKRAALRMWGWQLAVNALWPPVFFGFKALGPGLVVIVALLGAIGLTIRAFWPLQRGAALLLGPYMAWVCYATYLNVGFWRLNLQ